MLEFCKLLCWKWTLNYLKRLLPAICCLLVLLIYSAYLFKHTERPMPAKQDLNIYKFRYLIQNDICDEDTYLLVLVHSAANHFEHRNVMRDTLGNPGGGLSIKLVFLLAIAEEFQEQIQKENSVHKDIIQGNFIDSYRNLTYKHTMGLSWASANCNRTKYIMKMDDDIFVDIYQLMDYISNRMKSFDMKNSIGCYFQTGMPVVRDPVSKWYVSKTEFPPDTFNDYCSGWAYLTTPNVAERLYAAVKTLPYFWVDDIHITGSAAKLAGVNLIRMNHLYALETEGLMDWTDSSTNLKWDKMFAPTWGDLALSRRAHRKASMCYNIHCKCCYKRPTTPKPTTTSTTVKGVAELIMYPIH